MEIRNRSLGIVIGIFFIIVIITFYNTFSLASDYNMSSEIYSVNDGYIKGISPYTDINLFMGYFDLDNCYLKVVDKYNKEINKGYIFNGSKTILYDSGNHVVSTYTNIVIGDYSSDGVIDDKDYSFFGKYLVKGGKLEEYEKAAMDVNNDGMVKINDLVMLRDAVDKGVSEIVGNKEEILLQSNEKGRLVGIVTPGYGVNANLKWSSSDDRIATVNQNGVVTGGSVEGNVVIKATSFDGKKFVSFDVTVDNTIQLSSYNGTGYVRGNDLSVGIKSVSYDDLTCSVNNNNVASCKIVDKKLVITGLGEGSTEVHVNSSLYNGATYYFQSHTVDFRVMPNYLCASYNAVSFFTVRGFYTGNLSFSSTDSEIISSVKMEYVELYRKNMLRIDVGRKAGRAIATVTEDHANTSGIVTVDVYKLSLSKIGDFIKVGNNLSVGIDILNKGTLRCSSENEEIATCLIDGDNLIVEGHKKGNVNIWVYNDIEFEGYTNSCGSALFYAVVQEE